MSIRKFVNARISLLVNVFSFIVKDAILLQKERELKEGVRESRDKV